MRPISHRRWFWQLLTVEWLVTAVVVAWLEPTSHSSFVIFVALCFAAVCFIIQDSLSQRGASKGDHP